VPAGQIGARFFCETTDLDAGSKFLAKSGWSITLSEMNYIAKNTVELASEHKKKLKSF